MGERKQNQLQENIKCELVRKTYLKFLILKVRFKLSFEAYLKNFTISELFVRQISASYTELGKIGEICIKIPTSTIDEYFEEIIYGDLDKCFKTLINLNLESGQVNDDRLRKAISTVTDEPPRKLALKRVGTRAGKVKTHDPKMV